MHRKISSLIGVLLLILLLATTTVLANGPHSGSQPLEATEELESDVLELGEITPNEARFNPSLENPAMLLMMFSFTFSNTLDEPLEVRYPRLALTINEVEWTELASTDFQIGRLPAKGSQTIELQSMIIGRKLTPEQEPIWQAIMDEEPVDLVITGTIQIFPDDIEQTLTIERTLEDVILLGEWEHPAEATEEPESDVLELGEITPNEARFNPSLENPAMLMMFSFTFSNTLDEPLEVRYPRLTLEINGVEWTELASTDFQIGRLPAKGSQTIELQSMIIGRKLTPEQEPIWQAIMDEEPVNLLITGTIQIFPDGVEQTLSIERTLDDIILLGEWEHP